MYRNVVIFLAVALQCHYAAAVFAQPAECLPTISLSGTDWWIHEDADGKGAERGMPQADPSGIGWIPAAVPGNTHVPLFAFAIFP